MKDVEKITQTIPILAMEFRNNNSRHLYVEKSLSGAVTLNDRDFKSSKLSHVLSSLHTHQDLSELSCSRETGRKFASCVVNAGSFHSST